MTTPALIGLIPENFAIWKMEVLKLPGRFVVTTRRAGITITLVEIDGWWTVTKIRGGQPLQSKMVKRLPQEIVDLIERRRKEQRDQPKLSGAAQKAKGSYAARRDSSP